MNLMMREYSEKRDFIRMKVDARIELKASNPERTLHGVCKDLSGTGMAIEVEEPIDTGMELSACLPSSNASFPPFATVVRVVRTAKSSDSRYLLGVEILRVNG